MASRSMEIGMCLALITVLSWAHGASAQTSGCTAMIVSLAPCLSYITGNSSSTPSSSCCTQLSSVVQSQPQCLCSVLGGGAAASLGLTINQTQALALPGACKVQTPPVSQCNAAAGAPAEAAPGTSATPVTPAVPSVPAPKDAPGAPSVPSGSKTVPSMTNGGSGKRPGYSVMVAVGLAVCASWFI